MAIRFPFKGNTDSFTLRAQNDKPFSYCKYIRCADKLSLTLSLRSRVNGCGNPFLFKRGITDSFTLRVQNDISFSYCKYNKACG